MSARNGAVAPAAYPPAVDPQREFIKRGLDPEDEVIEVGVAIVGGGTAGLACANRLLQLLAEDPETMERLGEVPVAVIEKAKTCGGHSLSGAVMRPGPLQELFPDMTREQWREEGFAFGEVRKEAIYVLPSARTKVRIPPPPPQRNHGNEIVSVAALARFQQRQAEKGGAYILTETAATQLIVQDGRVVGVRSGDKGRGKDGEPLSNFEPGTDIKAQVTVLAGGYWAMPKLSMPGAVIVGDAGGMVNLAALKGVHYAIKSGMLAAEAIYGALKRGESSFERYEEAVEESCIGPDLWEQRNTRQPFAKGLLLGGPVIGLMIATKGRFPGGRWSLHRNDIQPMFIGKTKDAYPRPDGKYTFDKLSSVFISGNATRDDAPNHIRVRRHVPREIAEGWRWMCPAGVYEIPEDAPEHGEVDVIVNYTNCVQCGAITAKGGRLTTPEGGDGPLYRIT